MKKFLLSVVAMMAAVCFSYGQSLDWGTILNSISVGSGLDDVWVDGYTRSNGTYVDGYVRTRPNTTNLDNYSTSGNYNPFTNIEGSRARDYSPESLNYGSGRTIYIGPRGGQYYLNDEGRKVYVPKR